MLNKKKQIFVPKLPKIINPTTLFSLPNFSKNSYIQIFDQDAGQVENIELIIEKDIPKVDEWGEPIIPFRYSFSNLFFQKYFYLKLFSRTRLFPNNKIKSAFILLKYILRAKLRNRLLTTKTIQGGLKTFSFGFISFIPKNFCFEEEKLNNFYNLAIFRFFHKKRKKYQKRGFVSKRSKQFRRFDKQKRMIGLKLISSVV